ncbi:hypothetical protein NY2A_b293R [Paramecium bursaria Chlorella virus NY2A]|uniref:Uncharacterized protein b293R n=1 Tax=Paramecium bursaria Chlorella virus NY2A TaxID=46021 RepID=A7IWG8_PBCVN|nr:hypothetical protein NY2A_b293R [Paramecium bursaria Chlorella virus NY2A]ABT14692.1 hypothetical protein NY2A_b293R [Paramecium bursaria Chlorella virus NY2A]
MYSSSIYVHFIIFKYYIMSCPTEQIFDEKTNERIDSDVDYLSDRIRKVLKNDSDDSNCVSTKIDDSVVILNMCIQYIVLSFIILSVAKHGDSSNVVKAIVWISYFSLLLIAVQYRSVVATVWKLFAHGIDVENKVIILLSIFIAFLTMYIKKGSFGTKMAIATAVFIVIRLAIQMKNFLLGRKSTIPLFLSFIGGLFSPSRISKIYKSFDPDK